MGQGKIKLLPPDIASQIAAGEVIQRPASVVKELVENALDAQATEILIHIKDAGKTAILVDDNGIGMNALDASLAFEKHATSKINDVQDLYNIQTYGFRGEALPSIAAISRVEVKTRDEESEVGTFLYIEAGKIIEQKPFYRERGTSILVKDLFFNIPARKKFLKSDNIELAHIYDEIYRAALPNTSVSFQLYLNDKHVLTIPPQSLIQRILTIWGKSYQNRIVYFEEKTDQVSFRGYVVKPEYCKKTRGEQYFFVNHRFFRSSFLHNAIKKAYETLIPLDVVPGYIIFFDIHPSLVDVNIHPTKTEVKFANEQIVATFLTSAIKKAISSSHFIPSMDFDVDQALQFPIFPETKKIFFKHETSAENFSFQFKMSPTTSPRITDYKEIPSSNDEESETLFSAPHEQPFMQWKKKYIITSIKTGLVIINQHRAHVRILFEKLLEQKEINKLNSQHLLFDQEITLSEQDKKLFEEIIPDLEQLGFVITKENNSYFVTARPSLPEFENFQVSEVIEGLLEQFKNAEKLHVPQKNQKLPFILASKLAIKEGKVLTQEEMQIIVHQLFLTGNPHLTPDGKPIFHLLSETEVEQFFK